MRPGLVAELAVERGSMTSAAQDAIQNQDKWFGARGHRTVQSVCRGLVALMSKHTAEADTQLGMSPTPAEKKARIAAYLAGTPCAQAGVLSVFASMPEAVTASTAASGATDDGTDYMEANYHNDLVTSALDSYSDDLLAGGGYSYTPYESGMSDIDVQVFEATAAQQNDNLVTYNGQEQETYGDGLPGLATPYSVFMLPGWAKAMLAGCTAAVIGDGSGVLAAGAAGFLVGGPWGAAGGALGRATKDCGWGALAGWAVYHAFT